MRSIENYITLLENGISIKLCANEYNYHDLKEVAESLPQSDQKLLELELIEMPVFEMRRIIDLFPDNNTFLKITPAPDISVLELIEMKQDNIQYDFTITLEDED